FGVKLEVVVDEGTDEVVPMIVAFMAPQRERLARLAAGRFECLRMQLVFEERVGQALINQYAFGIWTLRTQHEFRCIVLGPHIAVVAQVAAEGLVPPGALHGVGNGGERRNRAVLLTMALRQYQSAVAAHGVAKNTCARGITR